MSEIYGKEQYSVDEWTNIIIERFSKAVILRFIKFYTDYDLYPCPWDCIKCNYNTLTKAKLELYKYGCREKYIWKFVNKIKGRKIKEKLERRLK